MPKETVAALAELGIKDRSSLLTILLMALRSSIEIYHMFMDYDGPNLWHNREVVQPFDFFAAVRQHERRNHLIEYRGGLEAKLPAPETETKARPN